MLGEEIKNKRIQMGYTQKQLAEKSGITQRTISRLETGIELNPTRFVICAISAVLDDTKFDIYWHEAKKLTNK